MLGQRLQLEVRVFKLAEPGGQHRRVAVEAVQRVDHLLDLLARHILELHAGQRRHEHSGELLAAAGDGRHHLGFVFGHFPVALAQIVELDGKAFKRFAFGGGVVMGQLVLELRLDGVGDGLDAAADLAHGLVRLTRELAHFVSHHGKAATGLAGTRRLDRGIQRQQIGLPGNVLDQVDQGTERTRFLDHLGNALPVLLRRHDPITDESLQRPDQFPIAPDATFRGGQQLV